MCVVETHMLKEEKKTILGYETVFRERGTSNSSEKMITVRGNIRTMSMRMQHEKIIDQTLWMQIDKKINTKSKKTQIASNCTG